MNLAQVMITGAGSEEKIASTLASEAMYEVSKISWNEVQLHFGKLNTDSWIIDGEGGDCWVKADCEGSR